MLRQISVVNAKLCKYSMRQRIAAMSSKAAAIPSIAYSMHNQQHSMCYCQRCMPAQFRLTTLYGRTVQVGNVVLLACKNGNVKMAMLFYVNVKMAGRGKEGILL